MQTIWVYDENNRVYFDEDGVKSTYPIYKHFWVPNKVVSETARSWVLQNGTKVPKDPQKRDSRLYKLSATEVEDDVWVHENRQPIMQKIQACNDVRVLDMVALVVGHPTR